MLKTFRTTAVLATGGLALGLLGATQAVAGTNSATPAALPAQAAVHQAYGKVVSHKSLNIRSRPTTSSHVLGSYHSGAKIGLSCKVHGQNVAGNAIWYKLSDRSGWVAARYVKNLNPVKYC